MLPENALAWSGALLLAVSVAIMPWRMLADAGLRLLQCAGHVGAPWFGAALGMIGFLLGAGLQALLAGAMLALLCLLVRLSAERRRQRYQALLVAELPNQLELIAMLLAAGLPLLSCLQRASGQQQQTPLTIQIRRIVNQVKAGDSLHLALADFCHRFPARELRLFSSAVQHAQQSGSGLADILYAQAAQRRQELFLRAEQQAMEIPVKLMLPLMLFIFPGTLLVLIVVLAGKLMWQL